MSGFPVAIIGSGRCGGSFDSALRRVGWDVSLLHHDDVSSLQSRHQLVLLCVPDHAVREVAGSLQPSEDRVLAHCAGALGLDVLSPHPRVGSLHPLVSLPDAVLGARRIEGAWFAVDGDPLLHGVLDALAGRSVSVADDRRVQYHAAAVVASNHLVALLAQVERIGATAGVPLEAYLDLVRGTVANVSELGCEAALTGPVARGDSQTLRRHVQAIDDSERDAYLALAAGAARVAGRSLPEDLRR